MFSYDAGRPVLKNISFEVKPGHTLAIIGATGSGKTTIINLLERFYDPQHGSILLDGVDLRRFEPHWLREQIGLVMQDIFIVPGSIRENILLDRELPEAEIDRILQLSQLKNLVREPSGRDRYQNRGGWHGPFSRAEAIAGICEGPCQRPENPGPGRGDFECGFGNRNADRAGNQRGHGKSDEHHNRPQVVHDQTGRSDHPYRPGRIVEQGSHEDLMEKEGFYHHLQMLQNGVSSSTILGRL